jgi:hypothetical protein
MQVEKRDTTKHVGQQKTAHLLKTGRDETGALRNKTPIILYKSASVPPAHLQTQRWQYPPEMHQFLSIFMPESGYGI